MSYLVLKRSLVFKEQHLPEREILTSFAKLFWGVGVGVGVRDLKLSVDYSLKEQSIKIELVNIFIRVFLLLMILDKNDLRSYRDTTRELVI